jgi:CRP-like cAMP-binding protein
MFTPEELRQAEIFACLDEAECARLAQTIADVRLEPGEWVFREGAPPSFYVLFEGRLRIVLDVHGKQTEFPQYELKQGEFLGEVPLLMGTPTFGSLRAQTACRMARLDKQQFHRLIRDSKEARTIILETLGERLLLIQQRSLSLPTSRVLIFGRNRDADCHNIREFLSANRIPYLLKAHGCEISMSHKSSPWENAGCESWMKTLKYEEVYRQEYRDLAEARASLACFIDKVYNQKRLHSALGYLPPVEFEQALSHPAAAGADA